MRMYIYSFLNVKYLDSSSLLPLWGRHPWFMAGIFRGLLSSGGGRRQAGDPQCPDGQRLLSVSHCSSSLSSRSSAVDITWLPFSSPKKSLLSEASEPSMHLCWGPKLLLFIVKIKCGFPGFCRNLKPSASGNSSNSQTQTHKPGVF